MRRKVTYPILLILLFLVCWMNLPKAVYEKMRYLAVLPFGSTATSAPKDELTQLQIENQNLRGQVERLYEWLLFERRIKEDVDLLKGLHDKKFPERRIAHLRTVLSEEMFSMPARVIYRDPSFWSSTLWVNVGEKDNRALKKEVIAKNSPVLSDGALVGVVDYVGPKQSRVRLITDSGLSPAVRVARGSTQNRELARQIQGLYALLENRDDLFPISLEKEQLLSQLVDIQKRAGTFWEDGYLAKGELRGSSACFWRSRGPVLKGIGFNYEYPDEEGPSKALKSSVPIIKEGDLLVTSGLDGVFPKGLLVGSVIHKEPLRQGCHSYEISVRSLVSNLNDLETLFILPPLDLSE